MRKHAAISVAGLSAGLVGVWFASVLPDATGVQNEGGATAASVDTAAVTLIGLGIGIFLAAFLGVVLARSIAPGVAGIESTALAFVAVVVPAIFAANLDVDRVSRIVDVRFVSIAVAPFAGAGLIVGLGLVTLRRKLT
jgi:hypothetical protein